MSDHLPVWPPPSEGPSSGSADPYAGVVGRPSRRRRRPLAGRKLAALAGAIALAGLSAVGALTGFVIVNHHGGHESHLASTETSSTTVTTPSSIDPSTATTTSVPQTTAPPTSPPTTAPTTNQPQGGSLVTQAIEQQVVRSTWNSFATAFATGDTATVAATSTPAVQQAVSGTFHCGCGGWPVASTVVNYSAPVQTAYPLYFFAELQGQNFDGQALMKEIVFTKSGPSQPWLVAYLGAFVNSSPLFGTASSESLVGAGDPVPEPLEQAPAQFATWFQGLDESGTPPPLPPHWIESGVMRENATGSEDSFLSDQAQGYTDSYSHSISAAAPTFTIPGGRVIFAELSVFRTVTAPSGHLIIQPHDRSTWGQLLQPGSYHRLVFHETIDIGLGESTTGTISQLTNEGGAYSITGS